MASAEEVLLLRASLAPDEFRWDGTPEEEASWEAHSSDRQSGEIQDDDTPQQGCPAWAFALRLSSEPPLWLGVRLSSDTTAGGRGRRRPELLLSGPSIPRSSLAAIEGALREAEGDAQADEETELENPVFDAYTAVQSFLLDHPLEGEMRGEGNREYESKEGESSASEETQGKDKEGIEMLRVIFWTHHLKAPSKRRDFQSWCPELSIWGIVKLGYPGWLCFEGRRGDVEEMCRRVKGLQWHALTLRSEELYTFPPPLSGNEVNAASAHLKPSTFLPAALLSCQLARGHQHNVHVPGPTPGRAKGKTLNPEEQAVSEALKLVESGTKLRTGCDEVETVGELVDRLRLAGMQEEELVEGLGLRVSNKS